MQKLGKDGKSCTKINALHERVMP